MMHRPMSRALTLGVACLSMATLPCPAPADVYLETAYVPSTSYVGGMSTTLLPTAYVVPTALSTSYLPTSYLATSAVLASESVIYPTATTYVRRSVFRPRRYVERTYYSYPVATSTYLDADLVHRLLEPDADDVRLELERAADGLPLVEPDHHPDVLRHRPRRGRDLHDVLRGVRDDQHRPDHEVDREPAGEPLPGRPREHHHQLPVERERGRRASAAGDDQQLAGRRGGARPGQDPRREADKRRPRPPPCRSRARPTSSCPCRAGRGRARRPSARRGAPASTPGTSSGGG